MKIYCPDKSIVTNLNINSTRNRFNSLSFIIEKDVDMLLISENKLRVHLYQDNLKRGVILKRLSVKAGIGNRGME